MLILAIALVPLFVLGIQLLRGGDYAPYGDGALIELGVREVGHHAVLLGPYSRFGWFHPGPMMFYVLAVPYRLLAGHSLAINLAAVTINGAALAGIAWIAHRRGGFPLFTVTLAVFTLFLQILGPGHWNSPWNPTITVMPFALLLFVAWELARGKAWAGVGAVGITSFIVQSHVLRLLACTALIVAATVLGAFAISRARREEPDRWSIRRRNLVRVSVIAAALASVLWMPPIVQQLTRDPGNLGLILRSQRDARPDHTLHEGLDLELRQVGTLPAWLTGARSTGTVDQGDGTLQGSGGWPAALSLAAFAAAFVIAWRRRALDALRLGVLVAIVLVTSAITVSRIVGPIYDYLVRWMAVGGLGIWVFLGAAILLPAERHLEPGVTSADVSRRRLATSALVAVVLIVSVLNTKSAVRAEASGSDHSSPVESLTRGIRAGLPGTPARPVLLRGASVDLWPWLAAVALQLERDGRTVWFDPAFRGFVGDRRAPDRVPGATIVELGTDAQRPILERRPRAREVAGASGIVAFVVREAPRPARRAGAATRQWSEARTGRNAPSCQRANV